MLFKKKYWHRFKFCQILIYRKYILLIELAIMADETQQSIPLDTNIDGHITNLLERLEAMRRDNQVNALNNRLSSNLHIKKTMQAEIRTLEFWR